MKIAFILPSLAAKGPIIFTKYLVEELQKKSDVTIFYFDEILDIKFNCNCIKIFFSKKISFDKYDFVITTMARPDLYAAKYIDKKKWIIGIHNYYDEDLKYLYNKPKAFLYKVFWTWALKKCSNYIFSSKEQMKYYFNKIGKKKCKIIPYGISFKEYNDVALKDQLNILKLKQKNLVLLGAVGSLIYRKGFHQIIKFLEKNSNYGLLLIGDGEEKRSLIELAQEKGVEDRILFLGYKENSIDYYKYFDIYCHVSYSEGFGLAMLEALSHGVPLVCSKLSIYDDFFNEKSVSFFEVDNPESLSLSISKVNESLSYYQKMSKNIYVKYFTVEKMADNYLSFLDSLK